MKKSITITKNTIGIIAPSRPIYNIKKEVESGIETLEKSGFAVKRGENLEKHFYYSAGTSGEKASDFNVMFSNPEVASIICATGGSSSNQILELIDFDVIKKNPKFFMGYSDITTLLLAIYKKTGLVTFHGPSMYEMSMLNSGAKKMVLDMIKGREKKFDYPKKMKVLRPGKAKGKLIGGNLTLINSLLATPYMPDITGIILFWEEVGDSPAQIDFKLQELRLSGAFEKIKGMIVGYLSDCVDKKYPQDNRSIEEIILERTAGYDFPIIKVDYFGHDISNFYTFPIGANATIDTQHKKFSASLR